MLLENQGLIEREVPILIFANKMDLQNSMSHIDVSNELELHNITDRPWSILGCSAKTGKGVDEGMNWLTEII